MRVKKFQTVGENKHQTKTKTQKATKVHVSQAIVLVTSTGMGLKSHTPQSTMPCI